MMTELQLAHQIIQELDRLRKVLPGPISAGHIASHAGCLYYGTMPYQVGFPSGKSPIEIRCMAIELAAMCMRFVLEQQP